MREQPEALFRAHRTDLLRFLRIRLSCEADAHDALQIVFTRLLQRLSVSAAEGVARAIDTEFNVHRGPEGTTVTIVEGLVEVRPADGPEDTRAQLRPGDQVALVVGGALGEARRVNADEVASWRTGRKVFIDQTLASVVADLNRYSPVPISLAANGFRRGDSHYRHDQGQ